MNDLQKILIVDDEPSICHGCKLILSENGYEVDIAYSGREGLEKISDNLFDLILLDIKLPDYNGINILKELNEKNNAACVIMMTGHGTIENAVDAMKNGAFDFITKPFDEHELAQSVLKALENRRLVQKNLSLKKQRYDTFSFNNIIGENPLIVEVFKKIERVAPLDSTVLLDGESGTGKELFANALHTHSKRAANRFLAVDCNTFSASLMESELFGHVKGAFTGADKTMPGIFEVATNGTLFLDEVTNLDMEIQGKLLRVLETGEYKPVGSSRGKKTNARIVVATNMNMQQMVQEKKFREDLFYRLNVFPIHIPPLRDRKNDIPTLAYYFLRRFCRKTGKKISGFSDDALKILVNFDWPGNVRQLKNVIERLVILSDGNQLNQKFLYDNLEIRQKDSANNIPVPQNIDDLKAAKKQFIENHFNKIEAAFLKNALSKSKGNITQAAKSVGMQRSNFSTLMKKYEIPSPAALKQ
jgi:DNA-binding NtrC family response regulator